MPRTKYDKYISREIVEESKYPQITSPMVKYRGDRGGRDLTFEWYCVDKPLVMDNEPEVNNFDRFMFFAGSNVLDLGEFSAEVEIPLGKEGEKQIINGPAMVHIPAGLRHGPVKFRNIKKPVVFYNIFISPKYSTVLDESKTYEKYVARIQPATNKSKAASFIEGKTPFRHLWNSYDSLAAFSGQIGFNGNLCWGYYNVKNPSLAWEPVHYHKHIDEWIIEMGGNPLDVEDFDAKIEMWWGEERETVVLDSPCVVHIPPSLIHASNDHRKVGKPFIEIVAVNCNDYFKEKDKVVVANEENGEVTISEGAIDYGW